MGPLAKHTTMRTQTTFAEFPKSAVAAPAPPVAPGRPLQALWHDARGYWAETHTLAQAADASEGDERNRLGGAWVHACTAKRATS